MKYQHELVELTNKVPAKILHQRFYSSKIMKPHFHQEIELVIPLNGYFYSYINGKKEKIDTTKIFLTNSNQIHYLQFPQEYKEGIDIITILLSDTVLKEYCPTMEQYDITIVDKRKKTCMQLIKEIDQVFMKKESFYQIEVHTLLYQLYTILLKDGLTKKEHPEQPMMQVPITKKVITYIDRHYQEPITLPLLAKELGFSSVYLSRYFKETCKQTITSYIQKVRLQHSYDDLMNTDMTINEIALENGFANVKAFIEIFKKQYTLTPNKYRMIKKLKNDNN